MKNTDQLAVEAIKRRQANAARGELGLTPAQKKQRRPGKSPGYGACSRDQYEAMSRGW